MRVCTNEGVTDSKRGQQDTQGKGKAVENKKRRDVLSAGPGSATIKTNTIEIRFVGGGRGGAVRQSLRTHTHNDKLNHTHTIR